MSGILDWIKGNWHTIGIIAIGLHTFLKAIVDAIDTNPQQDSALEKIVKTIGKVIGYLFGKRPK